MERTLAVKSGESWEKKEQWGIEKVSEKKGQECWLCLFNLTVHKYFKRKRNGFYTRYILQFTKNQCHIKPQKKHNKPMYQFQALNSNEYLFWLIKSNATMNSKFRVQNWNLRHQPWWRIILFPFRVMNMVKLFKKAFWKFPLDIKITSYLDVKVHFSSSWKEEESWIQA